MRVAIGVVSTGFLLTAVGAAGQRADLAWLQGPPPPATAEGGADHTIAQGLEEVGERYRGLPAYYNGGIYGDVIGTFFGLLATGAYAQAHKLRDGVCAAWRVMPPSGPFIGHATVGGVEVSLDTMCGTRK